MQTVLEIVCMMCQILFSRKKYERYIYFKTLSAEIFIQHAKG